MNQKWSFLARVRLLSLLPPSSAFIFHLVVPGGLFQIHSHRVIITILPSILSLLHILTTKDKLRSCYIISISVVFASVLCILFGAHPLKLWDNLSWSFLMTSLVSLPAINLIGIDLQQWRRVFLQCRFDSSNERHVYIGSLATLMGAWLGGFPILLDWNRPWQVWPIPCCVGALIGNFSGYLLSTLTFYRDITL